MVDTRFTPQRAHQRRATKPEMAKIAPNLILQKSYPNHIELGDLLDMIRWGVNMSTVCRTKRVI